MQQDTGQRPAPLGYRIAEPGSPDQKVDISRVLDQVALTRASDPALTVAGHTWTFAQLREQSLKAASFLHGLGVRPDQIVALPMANSHEQTAFFFGAWRLGATPLPLSPKLPDAELQKILAVADARVALKEGQDLHSQPPWSGMSRTASRFRAQTSGGSTGLPKVIVDTQPSVMDLSTDYWGWTRGNTMFVPGPTYHSGPMNHLIGGLSHGNHVVMMRKFEAQQAVELITRYRPHWALFVPTMMNRILKVPGHVLAHADFSSLIVVWHSAAACPAWLKQQWIELVGPEALWEIFGGSEGMAVTVISGSEWLAHRGSVGRAVGGEITILDEEGRAVPNGQVGEIYMRDLKNPRRFQVTTPAKRRMQGDWESFGDLGWLDNEGYLYLADRRVDMINAGGQNIYPAEVEAAIMNFPGVSDTVVFGQKDEDLGEMVCAQVYCEGSPVDVEDLLRYLGSQLVRYKIPRRITLTAEPIRNDAGKVRRSELSLAP